MKDHLVTKSNITNSSPGKSLLQHDSVDPAVFTSDSFDRTRTKKVYIQILEFDELKINLSYLKGTNTREIDAADSNAVRSDDEIGGNPNHDRIEVTASVSPVWRASSQGARLSAMTDSPLSGDWNNSSNFEDTPLVEANLPFVASGLIPSITDAPIKLSRRQIEHVFESSEEIIASLKNYFVEEIMRQIYIVIGSVDFVGNPTMIAKTIGTGVRDFFYQPYTSLFKSPNELGIGVVKGTLSLVSHSAQGVFGLTSKMSSAVGKVAARVSMDENFRKKQAAKDAASKKSAKKSTRKTKKELAYMAIQPFEYVARGAVSGVKGVFVEPYRGMKNGGGLCGCLKGFSIGIIGTVVRPIAGIADAFNHVSNSVQIIASGINILEENVMEAKRFRMPCVFGIGNRLLPFNLKESLSADLLRNYPIVLTKKNDPTKKVEHILLVEVLSNYEPSLDLYVVLSNCRMAVFQVRKNNDLAQLYRMEWQIDLSIDSLFSEVENVGHHSVELRVQTFPKSGGVGVGVSLASRKKATSTNKHELYKVRGKFQHKAKLLRLHNALCCLMGNFDNVVYERGLGPEWSEEGKLSFGYIQFESSLPKNKRLSTTSMADVSTRGFDVTNEKGLLDFLDSVSWEFLPTHSDEERAKGSRMSPKWLAKACTARMRNIISSSLAPCAPPNSSNAIGHTLSSSPFDIVRREQKTMLDMAKNDHQKRNFLDAASIDNASGEFLSNAKSDHHETGFEASQPRVLGRDEFGRYAQQGIEVLSSRVSLSSHLSNSADGKTLTVNDELRNVRERVERMEMMLEQILLNTQASSRGHHVRGASVSSTAHETQISRLTTDFPSVDSKSAGLNEESVILKLIQEVEDLKSQVADSQLQSSQLTIENEPQNTGVIHGAKRTTRTSFSSSAKSNSEVKNEKKRRKYFPRRWKRTDRGSPKEPIGETNVASSLQETPGASNKSPQVFASATSLDNDGEDTASLVARKLNKYFVNEGVEIEDENMLQADQTVIVVPERTHQKAADVTGKSDDSSEANNMDKVELNVKPENIADWLALESLAGSDAANNLEPLTDDWLKHDFVTPTSQER
uniref:Vacuolar protein sorting-associated protein 13 DH-like domain-containing protein n=1 Tax=Leptocylindrus danicus TaxID=163516 RepID=A0A7S2NZJ1_9STRA